MRAILHVVRYAALAVSVLCGCVYHEVPSYIVPLEEMFAEMRLDRYDRSLSLVERDNGEFCRVVSPRYTKARLEGTLGTVEPGGPNAFASDGTCHPPTFTWNFYGNDSGPSTFEISDNSTTWTFIVWQPFTSLQVELISHPSSSSTDAAIKVGDTVVLRVMQDTTLMNPRVVIDDIDEPLTLGAGLMQNGSELSFVMPELPPAGQFGRDFIVDGQYDLRIDRCDATRGCMTLRGVSDRFSFTLEP